MADLIFIEEGNSNYMKGLINYRKWELAYTVISEILQYQQRGYPGEINNIGHFLAELPTVDRSNSLYDLSLIKEPKGATLEQIL